ncbi:type I restriction enzyme HsdR N-terminal domain-containing protein [Xanthocytophaga agilis]|uniref:Type I restriction enzyme HsdR N-terminal domain-containing protein n=1 Tax=Xanthocytophaga agilis TaxID=3048010 RepID=A0AAE3RCP4_9BACT|nr:type I restriction enzyme HsdR N-terminal domain-containing protein [Xanthocytophaga agilis]MDJ1505989.1 type I restriction enzyme HsdR N-terminal domain-containing protein [Xanthocytophaga agilis]
MLELNLPPYKHEVIRKKDKLYIFDILRKKYIYLTPEEWVRQHFVHLLLNKYSYPKALIKAESAVIYNQLPKRADLLVFDRNGKPFLLIECKDTLVPLDDLVLQQAARYNHIVQAPYVILVNGLEWFCYQANTESGPFLLLEDIPLFPD